jgi:hypothetical protein
LAINASNLDRNSWEYVVPVKLGFGAWYNSKASKATKTAKGYVYQGFHGHFEERKALNFPWIQMSTSSPISTSSCFAIISNHRSVYMYDGSISFHLDNLGNLLIFKGKSGNFTFSYRSLQGPVISVLENGNLSIRDHNGWRVITKEGVHILGSPNDDKVITFAAPDGTYGCRQESGKWKWTNADGECYSWQNESFTRTMLSYAKESNPREGRTSWRRRDGFSKFTDADGSTEIRFPEGTRFKLQKKASKTVECLVPNLGKVFFDANGWKVLDKLGVQITVLEDIELKTVCLKCKLLFPILNWQIY